MEHYGTEAGFAAYIAVMKITLPCDVQSGYATSALVRASRYIDGRYGKKFIGSRTGGYAQALAWPRTGAVTRDGFAIPSNVVPVAVEYAAYEGALRDLTSQGTLSPDFVASEQVTREKVDVIEVSYANTSALGADAVRPILTVIDDLLFDLLCAPLPGILVV